MGVFPADHVIQKPAKYLRLLKHAFKAADAGKIAVLGIQPRWAETGYGYIEFPKGTAAGAQCRSGAKFSREAGCGRPPGDSCKRVISIGTPACSSGGPTCCSMPCATTCRRPSPCSHPCRRSPARQFGARVAESYPRCENISIDYAVMEKADNVVGVPGGRYRLERRRQLECRL